MWRLSIEKQYAALLSEYVKAEKSTMDARMYNFASSVRFQPKNRYINIFANEETIFPPMQRNSDSLELESATSPSPQSPLYINGNRVDLGVHPHFVACQAPTPACMNDFFTTVWRHKISLIIMLTQVIENGMLKADPYWPSDDKSPDHGIAFGDIIVRRDPDSPYRTDATHAHILYRPLLVSSYKDTEEAPLRVMHVQYIGWPDHGVPTSCDSFLALVKLIDNYTEDAPVVVHCSAGIGRTGTLIGAYAALCRVRAGTLTNTTITSIMLRMRGMRYGMVQRVEQFLFLYLILLQSLGIDSTGFARAMPMQLSHFYATMIAEKRGV